MNDAIITEIIQENTRLLAGFLSGQIDNIGLTMRLLGLPNGDDLSPTKLHSAQRDHKA